MALIIGLCGKAGSGKGEVSKILQKHFKTYVLPFAKPLKELACKFGWDGKKDERGRKFLQLLGTEIGRAYNPNYWVERWTEEANVILGSSLNTYDENYRCNGSVKRFDVLVADDTRFDNEAECIHKIGGYTILITGRAYDLGNNSTHASERGVDPKLLDYTIDNSENLDALEANVLKLVAYLTKLNEK